MKTKNHPIMLFFAVLGLFFVTGCQAPIQEEPIENGPEPVPNEESNQEPAPQPPDEGQEANDPAGFAGIAESQCENAGGHWNECGSPCAGLNAENCVAMCRTQCECGGIAGWSCPDGFTCRLSGEIADELGVCVED